MMINALRFRSGTAEEWRLVRFPSASGRFSRYQGLSGPVSLLEQVSDAIRYVLSGLMTPGIAEASLHLADDAGHLWIVDRRSEGLRIVRDGEMVGGDSERSLAAALQEVNTPQPLKIESFRIQSHNGRLRRIGPDSHKSVHASLHELLGRQVLQLCTDCARELGLQDDAEEKSIIRLVRELEPLYLQYRELVRQYKAIQSQASDEHPVEVDLVDRLQNELTLIDEISKAAEPLLTPGVNLKSLKEDLDAVESEIARHREALGITPTGNLPIPDFRTLLELLCRLEAQARLIRFAQSVRKYCLQKLSPIHQKYLDVTEAGVVADRQIVTELESCLSSLTLTMSRAEMAQTGQAQGARSWFERFKLRHHENTTSEADQSIPSETPPGPQTGEFESARLAIEYALTRLSELEDSLRHARERKAQSMSQLDQSHDELVRGYNQLRAEWQTVARSHGLAEDLTLEQLIGLVGGFGELAKLENAKQRAAERLRIYQAALTGVEHLVLDWRQKTASQKTSALSPPPLLIAEARDIIRYREPKKKRLDSLKTRASERLAEEVLRTMLKTRRQEILSQWRTSFDQYQVKTPPPIQHDALAATFKRTALIRALSLAQSAVSVEDQETRLFAAGGSAVLATIYLWEALELDNRLRLAFLEELEAAQASGLRLLLVADEVLGNMLAGLGVGMGHEAPIPKPPANAAPRRSEIGLTLPRAAQERSIRPDARSAQTQPMMSDKAIQALSMLTGRRS